MKHSKTKNTGGDNYTEKDKLSAIIRTIIRDINKTISKEKKMLIPTYTGYLDTSNIEKEIKNNNTIKIKSEERIKKEKVLKEKRYSIIKELNITERQSKKLKSFIRDNFKENEKYDNTIKFIKKMLNTEDYKTEDYQDFKFQIILDSIKFHIQKRKSGIDVFTYLKNIQTKGVDIRKINTPKFKDCSDKKMEKIPLYIMKEINRYSKEFKGYPELFEEDREFLIKHQNIKEKILGKKNIELGHQNFEMYSKYIKNYAKISLSHKILMISIMIIT